jgi:glycosyltransferase involved in cell wall biosynthesis
MPRFAIVTASFNQGRFLEETILSVAAQDRDDVEHVVLDGGSTDESVSILRKHDGLLSHWRSEPDAGQASAWNEGVRTTSAPIVGFINSDDLLLPGGLDAIERLATGNGDAEWLVGGTRYFGDGAPALTYPGVPQRNASDVLFFRSYAPQPGQFFRRSLIERVGPFDEGLHYAFDLDFFVRCALAKPRSAATSEIVAAFRFHGASKTVAGREPQMAEAHLVERRYWPTVSEAEGLRARRARDDYKGHLTLEEARNALADGRNAAAWKAFFKAARAYPLVIPTRAFLGTAQRLLGLRSK